jgi:hypothetical protein
MQKKLKQDCLIVGANLFAQWCQYENASCE